MKNSIKWMKPLFVIILFRLLILPSGGKSQAYDAGLPTQSDSQPEETNNLTSEARYYEIEPISYSFQDNQLPTLNYTTSKARIMTSFHPANKMAAMENYIY